MSTASTPAVAVQAQAALPDEQAALPERILWILPPQDDELFEHYKRPETVIEKGWRKTKANPLVPVGAALTVAALSTGLYAMQRGDVILSQKAMRGRVIFQGFTIGMIVLGTFLGLAQSKPSAEARRPATFDPATQKSFSPKSLSEPPAQLQNSL